MRDTARADEWRSGRYVAVDLETTGLDPELDRILSFGTVPVDDGRIRLERSLYRLADPGIPVPAETVTIHGIRPADLESAPPLGDVVEELAAALEGRIPIVWTSWVEASFLARVLGGSPRRWMRRMVDVRWLVVRLDERSGGSSAARGAGLHETARRFGLPLEDAHHALGDAFVTAQLFLMAATRLGGNARGMVRLGRRP